jgi:hypothetical protein
MILIISMLANGPSGGADSPPASLSTIEDDVSDQPWTEQALSALAAHGYRAGGARTAVIELLGEKGGCLDADDVAQRLRERGQRVGTASVYRALSLLSNLGLVHRLALAEGPLHAVDRLPAVHQLSPTTGNTQGMRFKIAPPSRLNTMTQARFMDAG